MTTDTTWSEPLPQPDVPDPEFTEPEFREPDEARLAAARRRNRKAMLAVLISLVALAGLAVGLVLLLGASASAVGGCGGG